ncbi:hypothetical protein KQI84_14325 [bacterium]|nr:hypothetical protein [bacterium]
MDFQNPRGITGFERGLLGVPEWFLDENPVAERILGSTAWRGYPLIGGAIVGGLLGVLEGNGAILPLVLRILAGELFAIVGAFLLIYWLKERWLRSVLVDDLDLTLLSDGEICHGLWVSHMVPLLRVLFGILVGEFVTFLVLGIHHVFTKRVGLEEVIQTFIWILLPVLIFWFNAFTLRMLGPRFLFASVQGPTERSYVAMVLVMLAESYGVLLLTLPVILFTALFAGILLSMLGASPMNTVVLTFLVILSMFKRDISESYHLSIEAGWRAWLAWQREGIRD